MPERSDASCQCRCAYQKLSLSLFESNLQEKKTRKVCLTCGWHCRCPPLEAQQQTRTCCCAVVVRMEDALSAQISAALEHWAGGEPFDFNSIQRHECLLPAALYAFVQTFLCRLKVKGCYQQLRRFGVTKLYDQCLETHKPDARYRERSHTKQLSMRPDSKRHGATGAIHLRVG